MTGALLAALPGELLETLGVHWLPAIAVVTILALIGSVTGGLSSLLKLAQTLVNAVRGQRGDAAAAEQVRLHRLFALYTARRIREMDVKDDWSDHRFAELEAEVEVETIQYARPHSGLARLLRSRAPRVRREKSLSNALSKSDDMLIVLEGDPGSGKSVALRYVARHLSERASNAKTLDAVIPLYVNLKALDCPPEEVNASHIGDFVLAQLTEGADRNVGEFLTEHFDEGKHHGTWLFLFDSFDEIPAVLSATDADEVVLAYSDAIVGFMHGMNRCRAVISSRPFRSPSRRDLPRYHIMPLTQPQQRELVSKAIPDRSGRDLINTLPTTTPDLVKLTRNPMFLGLLCEYVRRRHSLPVGWHEVFEDYVTRRLDQDSEKIQQLFGVERDELRRQIEELAFVMTASPRLGLLPNRHDLISAYQQAGFGASDRLPMALDALVWTKLAQTKDSSADPNSETFTFAHRRFQEYFATNVVLREPERISAHTLLTDGAWRETAVTLAQTHGNHSAGLLAEATTLVAAGAEASDDDTFAWPRGLLHVLDLLQDGFAGSGTQLPARLQDDVADIVDQAFERGTILDQRWALEIAGTAPPDRLADVLRRGFRGHSAWLRDVATIQASRLKTIPDDLARDLRRMLITMFGDRRLRREWAETHVQLLRLRPAEPFVRTAELLRLLPAIDAVLLAIVPALVLASMPDTELRIAAVAVVLAVLSWLLLSPAVRSLSRPRSDITARSPLQVAFEALSGGAVLVILMLGGMVRLLLVLTLEATSVVAYGILLLTCLYLVAWSPLTLGFLWQQAAEKPWRWPIQPLSLLVQTVRRKPVETLIAVVTLMAPGILVIVVYLTSGSQIPAPSELSESISRRISDRLGTPEVAPATARYALLAAVTLAIALALFIKLADRRRWDRRTTEQLTPEELVAVLGSLRTPAEATRFVREVRIRRLLDNVADAEESVRELLMVIEHGGWSRSLRYADLQDAVRERLESWKDTPVQDELGQLLETIQQSVEIPSA